jgi:hypothetical protein
VEVQSYNESKASGKPRWKRIFAATAGIKLCREIMGIGREAELFLKKAF